LVEVLLYIAGAMEPAASNLPKDTCCRWFPVLDVVPASVAAVIGFVVAAKAVGMGVLVLRSRAPLDGGLLWLVVV
jgi:hypothetical protein